MMLNNTFVKKIYVKNKNIHHELEVRRRRGRKRRRRWKNFNRSIFESPNMHSALKALCHTFISSIIIEYR